MQLQNTFRRFSQITSGLLAAGLLTVLMWANWEAPALHEFAPVTQLTILRVGGLSEPAQARQLTANLRTLDGLSACHINAATQLAVISFDPAQLSIADVRNALASGGTYSVAAPELPALAGPARPQCPIPASYLTALDHLRFTLNVRRFFVQGV